MRILIACAAAAAVMVAVVDAPAQTAGTPLVENRAAYLARCRQETLARYPSIRAQVDGICASNWDQVVATGPMAEAILGAAPAPGAAFNPTAARARLTALRGMHTEVTAAPNAGVAISWSRGAEPIPFNLEDALRVRGVSLTLIGCLSFGVSEGTSVYRANAPGKAPFALTVHFMGAAVASQSSMYDINADFSGRMPSLASLRRTGDEFAAACPN
ncbi:MAG: hypothetical protein GC189_06415 [Alphaproteobacteria bacterium]|nr:hypothetical protein [Alphaproteobacteria bacterium]